MTTKRNQMVCTYRVSQKYSEYLFLVIGYANISWFLHQLHFNEIYDKYLIRKMKYFTLITLPRGGC